MNNYPNSLNRIIAIIIATIVLFIATPNKAFAIIGGEEATAGEQGWMVGIALAHEANGYYAQFCGGTLIAKKWVLTAAHCTYNMDGQQFVASELDVLIGRNKLSSTNGERIAVEKIIRYQGFDGYTYNNDLALLKLAAASTAPTIRLATTSNSSKKATAFGWGVADRGDAVNTLRKAELPLADNTTCAQAYASYNRTVTSRMLCAGYKNGGSDACTGDSGGPIATQNSSGEWVQLGIISWGEGCAQADAYGVYTNLSMFRSWIAFQMIVNA